MHYKYSYNFQESNGKICHLSTSDIPCINPKWSLEQIWLGFCFTEKGRNYSESRTKYVVWMPEVELWWKMERTLCVSAFFLLFLTPSRFSASAGLVLQRASLAREMLQVLGLLQLASGSSVCNEGEQAVLRRLLRQQVRRPLWRLQQRVSRRDEEVRVPRQAVARGVLLLHGVHPAHRSQELHSSRSAGRLRALLRSQVCAALHKMHAGEAKRREATSLFVMEKFYGIRKNSCDETWAEPCCTLKLSVKRCASKAAVDRNLAPHRLCGTLKKKVQDCPRNQGST